MADGKIYITISDERLTPNGQVPNQKQENKKEEKQSNLLGDYAKYELFNFVKNQAQTFVSYTMGNIGNFTGNYQVQRNMSDAMKISNMIKSVGLATVAGFQYTGSIGGGLVAGIIAVGTTAMNTWYEVKSYRFEIQKQNNSIAENRKISGLDALNNNSRSGM